MKKTLILTSIALCAMQLTGASQAQAKAKPAPAPVQSPAEEFMAFKNMELGHKNDWFEHMRKLHDAKYDLMEQTHREWVAYSNRNSSDWEHNFDCSQASKDEIFRDQLDRAITLHRANSTKFKKMHEELHAEALAIHARHEKELNTFSKEIGGR